MIVPKLMPDELARGYINRLCLLNAAVTPQALAVALDGFCPSLRAFQGEATWCDRLAEIHGFTINAFHAHHTLLPFERAVRPAQACAPYGAAGDRRERNAHARHAIHGPRSTPNLCPTCVREDLSLWGFSYWRRAHQLPGVVICRQHRTGLRQARSFSWIKLPHDALHSSVAIDSDITSDALTSPMIRRFMEIAEVLAMRSRPISTQWITHVVRRQLPRIQKESGRSIRRLTYVVRDRLHGAWQTHFFPEIGLTEGELNSLDRVTTCTRFALATRFYALALTVLFDTSEDAMREVCSPIAEVLLNESLAESKMNRQGGHGLTAAAQAFYQGASIRDASKSNGIKPEQLEALLRTTSMPFSGMNKRPG